MPLPAITDDLLCPACGYMLRGLTEYRCPECGRPFDPAKLAPDPIPWTQRKRIGWIRAYVQTVMWSTFRVRRLSEQVRHPVSYRDAQLFRWVTIVLAYVPTGLAAFNLRAVGGLGLPSGIPSARLSTDDPWMAGSLLIGLLLALLTATGLPSYFFHPRWQSVERQNRCIALSYYACGPIAWIPVLFVLSGIAAGFVSTIGKAAQEPVAGIVMTGLLIVAHLLWWRGLMHLSKHAVGRETSGVAMVAVVGPVLWLLAVGVTLVAVRFFVILPGLIYYSLRG